MNEIALPSGSFSGYNQCHTLFPPNDPSHYIDYRSLYIATTDVQNCMDVGITNTQRVLSANLKIKEM